jgi:hypothetical protein
MVAAFPVDRQCKPIIYRRRTAAAIHPRSAENQIGIRLNRPPAFIACDGAAACTYVEEEKRP